MSAAGLDPLTPRHGGQQRRTADNALRRGQAGSPNDVDDAALATQDNEQEGGVGDRQLVPVIDHRRVGVGCVVALRYVVGHLGW